MSLEKRRNQWVIAEGEGGKGGIDRFPYWENEEIVLGHDFGTRLSINLPHEYHNYTIYEGIKSKNGKKR